MSWYDNDMNAGWNAVVGEVNFEGRLVVKGDANLILCDGSELIVPDGITVSKGSSLTIWQQSGKNGKLTASASESHYAGIGGYDDQDTGSITINGGGINAKAVYDAAAIGGGSAGKITITGGDITATPGSDDTQAIGRGANATESGTLNLGDSEHYLKVGTVSDDEVSYADADKRVSTAQSHNTVRVVPCTEHTYGEDGVCTLCGYQTTAYLITFVDEDGKTVLQQSKYMVDLTPKYKGVTPTKKPDAQNTYEFAGWSPEITKVTGKAIYKATFKKNARKLLIGDANGDGKVTINDVTQIQKFVAELVELTPDQLIAADTNCDGVVNINDATMIQKYIAELIDHLG